MKVFSPGADNYFELIGGFATSLLFLNCGLVITNLIC